MSHKSVRRKRFFEEGGDLARWRGRAARFTDRKKEASRKGARGRIGRDEY